MTCRYRAIWGAPLVGMSLLSLFPVTVLAEEPSTNVIPAVEVSAEGAEEAGYITERETAKTGKLDVAVEETPFAISVVNQEFIRDTGAKNIQDARKHVIRGSNHTTLFENPEEHCRVVTRFLKVRKRKARK